MRPVIGIARSDEWLNPNFWAICFSVLITGGKPVALSPGRGVNRDIDGLVLGGGTDVYPGRFSSEPKENYLYDNPRDENEIEWLKYADEKKIPILGICRGAQMLNVASGGTLHMDISKAYDNAIHPTDFFSYIFYRKVIAIKPGSLLNEIVGAEDYRVNSMHKQSIKDLGDDFEIIAKEPNGVVQAIEKKSADYYMGVQFHPELMIHEPKAREIFKRLVEASKNKKGKTNEDKITNFVS